MSVDGFSKFFVIKVKSTETNTKDSLYLGGIPPGTRNRGLETNGNVQHLRPSLTILRCFSTEY